MTFALFFKHCIRTCKYIYIYIYIYIYLHTVIHTYIHIYIYIYVYIYIHICTHTHTHTHTYIYIRTYKCKYACQLWRQGDAILCHLKLLRRRSVSKGMLPCKEWWERNGVLITMSTNEWQVTGYSVDEREPRYSTRWRKVTHFYLARFYQCFANVRLSMDAETWIN